jgi:hypothetical protein
LLVLAALIAPLAAADPAPAPDDGAASPPAGQGAGNPNAAPAPAGPTLPPLVQGIIDSLNLPIGELVCFTKSDSPPGIPEPGPGFSMTWKRPYVHTGSDPCPNDQ